MESNSKKAERKQTKPDTKYYDDLLKKLKDEDSTELKDPETLEIFFDSIIDQIKEDENELKKCLNSFHIDYFIFKCSIQNFATLFQLIVSDDNKKLNEFLNDRRISRAYEACLTLAGDKIESAKSLPADVSNEYLILIQKCLKKLGAFFTENFESILETQDGIFSLRSFIRIIGKADPIESQTNNGNANTRKKENSTQFNIKNVNPKIVPEEWNLTKFIKKFSENLTDLNILEIGLIPSVSPCISLLMRKLNSSFPSKSSKIIRAIHEQFIKKPNSFHSMIQDSIGSRFIESFLYCCPSDLLIDHYLDKIIIPNIVAYSKHTYANYSIQTLLKHRLETEPGLAVLYDSLLANLGSIVDLHSDLIYKNYLLIELIDACHKSKTLDFAHLVETIMEYFGCDSKENKINFLRVLLAYEKLDDIIKEGPIDQSIFLMDLKPIGCTIASKLIEYDDKNITKSFNSLNANELEHLCTNNVGSHLIEKSLKLFNSIDRTVWVQTFFDKLKGRFLNLCTNPSGSFVMETIWSIANLKQRISIADELKQSEIQLKNDRYARFLMNKIGLNFYKRKPEEWKQIQSNEFKKRKLFADLIDDSSENSKIKNKNENSNKKLKS